MRSLLPTIFVSLALAAPESRSLRPEEHWQPAKPLDISKYKARYPTVSEETGQTFWGTEQGKIDNAAYKLKTSGSTFKDRNLEVKQACGIEGPLAAQDRIVGGVEAAEHAWPWQVAIIIDDSWFCGGAIISENYVLTAAHCVEDGRAFRIFAGAHNHRLSSEPHRVEITSNNGWTHPQWDPNNLANDLALIELPSPLEMNDYITASCLPADGTVPSVDSMVSVTGWGRDSDSASGVSDVLREVRDIPVMDNDDCNAVYGIVGPGVICIDTQGGRGSCNVSLTGLLLTNLS